VQSLKLVRNAAEAEGLRLRCSARRTAVRVAFGLAALCFLLGAIVFGHLAAWFRLSLSWGESMAALIIAGADLVVTVVPRAGGDTLLCRAFGSRALALRRRALDDATSNLTLFPLITLLLPFAGRLLKRR